jgi:hypothetical protein
LAATPPASPQGKGRGVKSYIAFAAIIVGSLASPLTGAQAQGIPDGFVHGVQEGNRIAGPIGAVVGGGVGTVIGGFEGLFGIRPVAAVYPEDEPRPYRHRVRHSYHHVRRTHTTS